MKRFIYLISPNKINDDFYSALEKVLACKKVNYFQLRLKNYPKNKILKIGKIIKTITNRHKVKLIINDNPNIAKEIGAAGCHIGQSDTSYRQTNKILKRKIIGLTCHGSKRFVEQAIKYKVNYIAIGSFFKSKLKPNAKKAKMKLIKETKKKQKYQLLLLEGLLIKIIKN